MPHTWKSNKRFVCGEVLIGPAFVIGNDPSLVFHLFSRKKKPVWLALMTLLAFFEQVQQQDFEILYALLPLFYHLLFSLHLLSVLVFTCWQPWSTHKPFSSFLYYITLILQIFSRPPLLLTHTLELPWITQTQGSGGHPHLPAMPY